VERGHAWQKASEIPGLLPKAGAPAIQPRGGPARRVAAPDASSYPGNSRLATDVGGGAFRVALVLSQAFGAFRAKLGIFLLMALIPLLTTVIVVIGVMALGFGFMAAGSSLVTILIVAAVLLVVVVYLVSQAMIAYGTFQNLSGRNFTFGDAFQHVFQRISSILGAVLLMALAAFGLPILVPAVPAGLVGLIWPTGGFLFFGLIAFITFYVAMTVLFVTIPACTIEPLGPRASLVRSVDLTKGYRWKVFGLLLIAWVGTAIAAGVLSGGARLVGGAVFGSLVNAVSQLFIMAFFGVLPAATYSSLRKAKEGIDVSDIADVFE